MIRSFSITKATKNNLVLIHYNLCYMNLMCFSLVLQGCLHPLFPTVANFNIRLDDIHVSKSFCQLIKGSNRLGIRIHHGFFKQFLSNVVHIEEGKNVYLSRQTPVPINNAVWLSSCCFYNISCSNLLGAVYVSSSNSDFSISESTFAYCVSTNGCCGIYSSTLNHFASKIVFFDCKADYGMSLYSSCYASLSKNTEISDISIFRMTKYVPHGPIYIGGSTGSYHDVNISHSSSSFGSFYISGFYLHSSTLNGYRTQLCNSISNTILLFRNTPSSSFTTHSVHNFTGISAVVCYEGAQPVISNSFFIRNSCTYISYFYSGSNPLVLDSCVFDKSYSASLFYGSVSTPSGSFIQGTYTQPDFLVYSVNMCLNQPTLHNRHYPSFTFFTLLLVFSME